MNQRISYNKNINQDLPLEALKCEKGRNNNTLK